MIKARFEDSIKDISYVIKLFNYIVKNTNRTDIQLYIIGYGPSEILYNNLIKYYNLQNNIHINQKEPLNYIYISSSPYETLGYSILETIANGNRALIFPGKDKVLKEVYSKYYAVEFLEKNIIRDSEILISLLNEKYTQYKRKVDVENLKNDFLDSNYSDKYLLNFENSKNEYTIMPVKTVGKYKIQKRGQLERLNNGKILYARMKEKPLFSKLLKNDYFFKKVKEIYGTRKSKLHKKVLDKIIPDENKVFIESFHGSNFSGDPKYLALNIKEMYREKEVYVSSKNSLVDIEIRNYGFKPVRFGSENYIETFRKCKYVFMNGNSWDKVDKHKNQKFIQTWHGFPLKKMVNDLGDDKERILQNKLFQPRMEKWDYLLSSSTINSMLLKSAFRLENNLNLNILEYGAPRNEFLLENYDENNWQKLQRKYLFIEDNEKKYILFCPTWRKSKRENLTNINLKKLLDYLPENYEIIVKLHPNESGLRTKYNKLDSRIHCFYNEFVDIQELYLLCDVMITDYSSTIFDYAHLNKPIFLLQEDSKTYQKDVGFYFNIFELGKFPVASLDEKKLALQIKNIKQIDYTNLIERIVNNDKKGSTKDILNEVFYN
ncbi:CDP-glycerol glycerophosphotransferase family protein [Staphylococcus edaphicus]|uniref:CDP-glycerol glycerophosphotransferase family protein n=1 Tax=Staphylococcus edaphicus TaxID=1955013 RepID=A0ABY4QDB2_9STAP|nr:CDP-glycerol glycerophosphotransferase family protein [Staphylococcus edaphicus]UQW81258.1 CDP-glycerol glycerophosphotransferase family protein [Staphylococcus edaphicus]